MNNSFTLSTLVMGYLMGLIAVSILRNFLPGTFYLIRVWSILKLFVVFIYELLVANIEVVKIVLQPKINVHPRSEEHTSELQSRFDLVCRLLLENKKNIV